MDVDPATGFRTTGRRAELAISTVPDRRQFAAFIALAESWVL